MQKGSNLTMVALALCVVLAFVAGMSIATRGRASAPAPSAAANQNAVAPTSRLYVIANHSQGDGTNGRDAFYQRGDACGAIMAAAQLILDHKRTGAPVSTAKIAQLHFIAAGTHVRFLSDTWVPCFLTRLHLYEIQVQEPNSVDNNLIEYVIHDSLAPA